MPQTFMVTEVAATYGGTINTGNFENIKLEYSITMKVLQDCVGPEVDKALQDAHNQCKRMFDVKANAIKSTGRVSK